MSRFYVGQRVRIKFSNFWPELGGREGTVVGTGVVNATDSPYYGHKGWFVSPDCWGTKKSPTPGVNGCFGEFCPVEIQLEPLTDCYDKTTWDTCIWQPEHLRVPA